MLIVILLFSTILYLFITELTCLTDCGSVSVSDLCDRTETPADVQGEPLVSPDDTFIAFRRGGSHGCHVTFLWSCRDEIVVYSGGEGACAFGDNGGVRVIGWRPDGLLVLEGRLSGPGGSLGGMPGSGLYLLDPEQLSWHPIPSPVSRDGWRWDALSLEEQAQITTSSD